MKKLTLLAIAVMAICFASCKKDYTCECTSTINGVAYSSSSSNTGKMKKKDADSKCNEGDKTYEISGSTYKIECMIK